jgi:hypothetical protein
VADSCYGDTRIESFWVINIIKNTSTCKVALHISMDQCGEVGISTQQHLNSVINNVDRGPTLLQAKHNSPVLSISILKAYMDQGECDTWTRY